MSVIGATDREPVSPETAMLHGIRSAALIAVLGLPALATASLSVSPTTTSDGSYKVSWTDDSGGTVWRAYLLESVNGGAWSRTSVTGSHSRSFTGRAPGTYSYLVEIYEYSAETRTQIFDHQTNVATVSVTAWAAPGVPGAISGPGVSTTGSYTLAWGAATNTVARYELFENGVVVYSGTAVSASLSGRGTGTYSYVVRACNAIGCGPGTGAIVVTVTIPPGVPGAIGGPATSTTGSYTLAWGVATGTVTRYELLENGAVVYSGTSLSAARTGKTTGTYSYVARACNGTACGGGTAAFVVTVAIPPGVPGAIGGPATSTTGSYTLAWGAAPGTVTRYELLENGALVYSGTSSSAARTGKTTGTYSYVARACNGFACGAGTAPFVVSVAIPPGAPGAIIGPATSTTGSYTLTWGVATGTVTRYELLENGAVVYSGPARSAALSGKTSAYSYVARACNGFACGPGTPPFVVTVAIPLTVTLPDSPPVEPTVPDQARVGAIPGTPAADGGSARYTIPIEVPPGYAGMQPEVALVYGSRNGNGIAGVGWSLSATRSVYRCPRTLRQDGANAPVMHGPEDRLCFDGQRLVSAAGTTAAYGTNMSQYRTEVEEFARITLVGDMSSWSSYFRVEHKSGRVSFYKPLTLSAPARAPDTWYLDHERNPQGSCVRYAYSRFTARGNGEDEEWVLASIGYTGAADMSANGCYLGSNDRRVDFDYTADRPDKRTTYAYGVANMATARLAAIRTSVGTTPVRRYDLSYKTSGATGRSLLQGVALCGGATCTAGVAPTSFSYEERASDFWLTDFGDPAATLTLAGDYDGDGMRDRLYSSPTRWSLTLSGVGADGAPLVEAVAPEMLQSVGFSAPGPLAWDPVDANNDGRSDLFGPVRPEGAATPVLGLGSWTSAGWQIQLTNVPLPADRENGLPGSYQHGLDYDGDGLVDVRVTDGTTFATSYYRGVRTGSPAANAPPAFDVGAPVPAPPATTAESLMTADLNGDGRTDTFFDTRWEDMAYVPRIGFLTGQLGYENWVLGCTSSALICGALQALGGPEGPFKGANDRRRWLDVNGDGLKDIYEPGAVYVNRGGPPRPGMFRRAALASIVLPGHDRFAFAMDVDADGADELVVPTTRKQNYEWCQLRWFPVGEGYYIEQCGDGTGTHALSIEEDRSVFNSTAYRFRENGDGSFEMIPAGDGPEAPIHVETAIEDWTGDGLNDLAFRLWEDDMGYYPRASVGSFLSRNLAPAPDLLLTATNGLGSMAAWSHQPLSEKAVPSCALPASGSFYVANHEQDRARGYVFFASSMWAVSAFETDHGLALTLPPRKTCYRYEDAMLDVEGRGFQGFKKIVVEEQSPPAAGEPPGVALQPSGVLVSANNLRTTTQFLQEFPYTNRIEKVTVERAADAAPMAETTESWLGLQNLAGAWVVYPRKTVEKRFDFSREAPLVKTISFAEVDPESGEATGTCAFTEDAAAKAAYDSWMPEHPLPIVNGQPIEPHAISFSRETRWLTNDKSVAVWWLGRVDWTEKVADFLDATQLPAEDVVTCPTVPESVHAKKVRTDLEWYGATAAEGWGFRRNLKRETLSARGVVESRTTITGYDTSGNVLGVSKEDVRGGTGTVSTTYGYTADGYFRTTETNPVGHVSTVTTDPATGLVLTRQAVQGGPRSTTEYDGLGRVLKVTADGEPPVYERLLSCQDCAMARQVIQAGAPTTTEYLDRLGRVVSTTTEGFDGTPIVTTVEYNARGLKTAEHAPRYATSPGTYRTLYSGFDALGRVGTKTVERDPALFAAGGTGEPTLTTTYEHAAFKTSITVHRPEGSLLMSRTTNAAGKLIETTQDVSTPTPHQTLTRYLYDPAGSVTHIVDTAGNVIAAAYDDLGRKTRVDDPDRGTWTWEWDGVGRLTKQTDARGFYTKNEYDGIGRIVTRRVKSPSDTGESIDSTWSYDPEDYPGGPRQRGVLARVEGPEVSPSVRFTREYSYDSLLRPYKVKTTLPAFDPLATAAQQPVREFVMEYAYDRHYGRQKAIRYPDEAIVGFEYGPRGHLLGETELKDASGTRGTQYRRVGSMSPGGQVTEQVFGNCAVEVTQYDASKGMPTFMSALRPAVARAAGAACPAATLPIRQLQYGYDHLLNLKAQTKNFANGQATETYDYDDLQRILSSSRQWVGSGLPATVGTDWYGYDDLGNITSKSDYASQYTYGNQARTTRLAGPHAVLSVVKIDGTTATFQYDENGNMLLGDGRLVTFDRLDRPIRVVQGTGSVTTDFLYAPDGARYRQKTNAPPEFGPKTIYYVDKDYELEVWESPATVVRKTYVGATVLYQQGTGLREARYLHLDRLGSTDAVTSSTKDAAGAEASTEFMVDAHGYDPFGKPRAGNWTLSAERMHPAGDLGPTTDRGFTGHEVLDNLYLIHMNGRVYDYRLGRFLSVDPFISDPASSQSINPYSYIGNNPLSGVDPTGYCAEGSTKVTGTNICRPLSDLARPQIGKVSLGTDVMYGAKRSERQEDNGATPQGARTPTANPAEHGGPPDTSKSDTEQTKEWPLSTVGTDAWRRGWKDAYGSEVTPGLGDRVSLGGKSWTLGEDPRLDETLVMFIEQKDRLAMSRAGGYGLAAGEAARLGVVALDAALARAATKAAGSSGSGTAAYEAAVAGGKHAGTLRNYAGRPAAEIEKAIASYERQVSLHQQKIANPAQFAERWGQMTAHQQAGLLNKWRADAARNQDLADVLRGLLGSR